MSFSVRPVAAVLSRRRWIVLAAAATAGGLALGSATGRFSPATEAPVDRAGASVPADLIDVAVRAFEVDSTVRGLPQWAAVADSLVKRLNAVPGIRAKAAASRGRQTSGFTVRGTVMKNGERVVLNVGLESHRKGVEWTSTYWRGVVAAPSLFDAMVSEIAAEIIRQQLLRPTGTQSSEAR